MRLGNSLKGSSWKDTTFITFVQMVVKEATTVNVTLLLVDEEGVSLEVGRFEREVKLKVKRHCKS